ncbi:MAG: hypothetical protein ABL940_09710 [Bacteroidia bacterium]
MSITPGFVIDDTSIDTTNWSIIRLKGNNEPAEDFKPTAADVLRGRTLKLAYEEISQYKNQFIDKTIYQPWLEKYVELCETVVYPKSRDYYFDCGDLSTLYSRISEINKFLLLNTVAIKAIRKLETIDENNEQDILKWVVKYEKPGWTLLFFDFVRVNGGVQLTNTKDAKDDRYYDREYFPVCDLQIDTADFAPITKFDNRFFKYYWDVLFKYEALNNERLLALGKPKRKETSVRNTLNYYVKKMGIKL